MEVSIDNTIWKIGCKFMGFYDVPSGFHIFSIEHSSEIPSICYVPDNGIVILKVEPNLSIHHMKSTDKMYSHLKDIGRGSEIESAMVKYQIENFDIWVKNTDCISKQIVDSVNQVNSNEKFQFPDIKSFSKNFYSNLKGSELTKNKLDMTNLLNCLIFYDTKFCKQLKEESKILYKFTHGDQIIINKNQKSDSFIIKKISNKEVGKDKIEEEQTIQSNKTYILRLYYSYLL